MLDESGDAATATAPATGRDSVVPASNVSLGLSLGPGLGCFSILHPSSSLIPYRIHAIQLVVDELKRMVESNGVQRMWLELFCCAT